ncbi:hypothetical protein ACP275_10G142100 [Erythranthe tilingii]
MDTRKMGVFLRMFSTVLLVLSACLVGLDTQTKVIFYTFTRKATFRDLDALYLLVWIDSGAAVYNLLQLFRSFRKNLITAPHKNLAWGVYFLDQVAAYVVFAANTAAIQASALAVTGEESFQWMKLCNRYTRFCFQIGGALVCSYIAAILMAIISTMSAYALFRLYSPKQFLLLKGR